MVGDHAMAGLLGTIRVAAGRLGAGQHQGAQRVRVVVVVLALQDGGKAFQPHAGVDRGPWQWRARARRPLLVLHEDEVPDLDEPITVLVRAAGRPAGNGGAVIEEDLAAGAARSGVAHAPEVVGGRDADDPLLGQPGDPAPEDGGFLILGIDGDKQPVGREREVTGDEVPGVGDRLFLEIVAEGEVPQHLEKSVVAGGVADIVEVVVLAAGTHAFLRRRRPAVGPPLLPREDVLELHHAAVGEHQRGIVSRHKGRAFHHGMAVTREIVEEGGADVVAAGHIGGGSRSQRGVTAPSAPITLCHVMRRRRADHGARSMMRNAAKGCR